MDFRRKKMKIELAKESNIVEILEIIKQRCDWFAENQIEQWGSWYYEEFYDEEYFLEMLKKYELFVVKQENEIIGTFLLKYENEEYWKDKEKAIYLDHFVTKIGNPGLGEKILEFIQKLAKEKALKYLRLECMRSNPKINEYYKNHGFQDKGQGDVPYEYRLWEKEVM